MRTSRTIRKRRNEAGIALLIAIFILLLIGVVAIALIVSSGTESALAGNYRSATSVYYAGVAGLEEVRGRLRGNDPNSFNNTAPGFLPKPVTLCAPVYVINPAPGEVVAPWDPASVYFDNEFGPELGALCGGVAGPPNNSLTTPSIWNRAPLNGLPFPGPLYKWVRINGLTERSLNLDTSPYDGTVDATLVYYDGTNLNDTNTGNQVLEVTALAVLPNGSRRLLQYMAGPSPLNLTFPSALTILGTNIIYNGPTDNVFQVEGNDQVSGGTCNPVQPTLPGVGVPGAAEVANVINGGNGGNGIPAGNRNRYDGTPPPAPPAKPSVLDVSGTLPLNMQSPAALEALVQFVTQNPDAVLPNGSDSSSLPSQMSSTHPVIVVVNGDFLLFKDAGGNSATGFGLLVVTGKFSYTGDAGWKGIVLVVGKGEVNGSLAGNNEFDGAVLVAKTRDNIGNLLPAFGQADVDLAAAGGNGIFYNSCRINDAIPAGGTKILSFHEIPE